MAEVVMPAELLGMFREVKTPLICVVEDGGEPHASAMNWWYEADKGTFFMNPAEGTRKARLMREGVKVCFATMEHMRWKNRGFVVWGTITKVENGFLGLLKNLRNKYRIWVTHGGLGLNFDSLRFWGVYAFHRDIYYSTLLWRGSFITVKPVRARYWFEDGVVKEVAIR